MFFSINRPKRMEPIIHPTSATPTRSMPAQNSQMQRPASHQVMSRADRKCPRPERNGSVYNEAAVHHAPAISTSTGTSSTTHVKRRDTGCPLINDDRIVGCHVANQLNGAVRRSTAPCHCAGKSCANESNIF